MKEKLQNEVTKIKEKLEIYLSECNNLIKICEKINKGVKKLENNKEKFLIKTLSYISEINKNQKRMNILIGQLMKNIKINFEEDKTNIKFEEYYFNGIPIPNLEVNNITSSSFEITWKIDDLNIINFDKNKISYKIELRKENENFNQIYQGNKNNYFIEGLYNNTIYEIRLCSSYDEYDTQWISRKVKILNEISFDNKSLIIGNNAEYETCLKSWINPNKNIKAELLYRLTKDEASYKTFHNKCDNKGPTLTLIQDENEIKTGGYTPLNWDSNSDWKKDNDTFIFNLNNKKKFGKPNKDNTYSIYCSDIYGPWFDNYGFEQKKNMKECKFQRGDSFLNANEIIPNENKDKYFKVKEVEVYKIIFY